ncbi:oligopeptide/dipeptide ABC transporter ATP-binding protein [Brevibacillus sp. MER 51]|uniref:ABC transporter ATP-binding protein n=1 Tax=Brevibacillus sp. MER 51 TaxID=2939560 RepID=UPI0020417771|nr:oligopeptide/dipeptide ABC transporter ATP-binding protein [Brevibacillus sp. MER 51]MCM3141868.1 ATP-binding cassette domain-containing protein [Brevibacillus sp. MER 51]
MTEALLDVRDLKKYFSLGTGFDLKAVDGVSFTINKGETFGLVGESGCGKSTLGRTIIRLYDHTDGEVLFKGKNVHQLRGKEAGQFNRDAQMIFQDPQASLNPRMTVEDIIAEGLDIHHLNRGMRRERVAELLHLVGLHKDHAQRFPHEFSGGQRQRIGIARALAVEPEFIIADEPISALDVSIQAQVVNLLEDLQHDRGLTYLFIAHDLSMVKHISNRIGVMYLGKMVELASSYELYARPLHPYTQALLSSVPVPDPTVKRERIVLQGDLPSPANKPSGCGFRTRCPLVQPRCAEEVPRWQEAQPGHWVACHLIKS